MKFIKINQIKLPLDHTENDVINKACKKSGIKKENIIKYDITKRSIDARKKPEINFVYNVTIKVDKYEMKKCPKDVFVSEREKEYNFKPFNEKERKILDFPPVIVGFGPAGMFCGCMLAKYGYKPIILERGSDVDSRTKDIEEFWNSGILNQNSNVQFGEGGAGTFSDGKLNTGIKDKKCRQRLVLESLVEFGAPESILYESKPHIGTDILCKVVKNIREYIIENGGQVLFNTKLTKICKSDNIYELEINGNEILKTDVCVLALGHSARDTFEMLCDTGFKMEQKPFAIGVRVEHKQETINLSQYGMKNHEKLPASPYKIAYNSDSGRNVYSFCMCPGGYVVNASSEKDGCVVNGMSYSKRDGQNANSAIVATVMPDDFEGEHPLAGVYFQRELEKKAWEEGKGFIPIQLYKDFKDNKISDHIENIIPQIKGKYTFGNIKNILPKYVSESIETAMPYFGHLIKNFDDGDVVFSAIESRTSSPVRIIRNDIMESNYENIYPCGEGAGYAGGITSAAIDGIKVFECIANKYRVK